MDFAEATGPDSTHPLLLKWVKSYFRTGVPFVRDREGGQRRSNRNEGTASSEAPVSDGDGASSLMAGVHHANSMHSTQATNSDHHQQLSVDVSHYPPLYLQHEGTVLHVYVCVCVCVYPVCMYVCMYVCST